MQTKELYQISAIADLPTMIQQANFIFARLSDRLDQLEGVRGVTTFEGGISTPVTNVFRDYTIDNNDYQLDVDTSQAVTITLTREARENGQTIHVKDVTGNAATNNITVVTNDNSTIQDSSSAILNSNYINITFYSSNDKTEWHIQ